MKGAGPVREEEYIKSKVLHFDCITWHNARRICAFMLIQILKSIEMQGTTMRYETRDLWTLI